MFKYFNGKSWFVVFSKKMFANSFMRCLEVTCAICWQSTHITGKIFEKEFNFRVHLENLNVKF